MGRRGREGERVGVIMSEGRTVDKRGSGIKEHMHTTCSRECGPHWV